MFLDFKGKQHNSIPHVHTNIAPHIGIRSAIKSAKLVLSTSMGCVLYKDPWSVSYVLNRSVAIVLLWLRFMSLGLMFLGPYTNFLCPNMTSARHQNCFPDKLKLINIYIQGFCCVRQHTRHWIGAEPSHFRYIAIPMCFRDFEASRRQNSCATYVYANISLSHMHQVNH